MKQAIVRMVLCVVLALAAAGCLASCKKDEAEAPATMPPPVGETEAERGIQACKAYAERVCACARAKPESTELAEQCELAPDKVHSLNMVLEVNRSPKDVKERVLTAQSAQRIISSCIAAAGKLDSRGCPRP